FDGVGGSSDTATLDVDIADEARVSVDGIENLNLVVSGYTEINLDADDVEVLTITGSADLELYSWMNSGGDLESLEVLDASAFTGDLYIDDDIDIDDLVIMVGSGVNKFELDAGDQTV